MFKLIELNLIVYFILWTFEAHNLIFIQSSTETWDIKHKYEEEIYKRHRQVFVDKYEKSYKYISLVKALSTKPFHTIF